MKTIGLAKSTFTFILKKDKHTKSRHLLLDQNKNNDKTRHLPGLASVHRIPKKTGTNQA